MAPYTTNNPLIPAPQDLDPRYGMGPQYMISGGAPQTPQYQDMSQAVMPDISRMQGMMMSPYATMSSNSWLAQNHPALAGHLDNAFLTLANMGPTGRTAGENISNVARGLMGANQFHRQQAMTAAMLPYQMQQMRLQQQDVMSQINQRNAAVPLDQAREAEYMAMAKKNSSYQSSEDMKIHLAAVASGAVQDPNMTADQAKATTAMLGEQTRQANRATPGGLLGEILDNQLSDDPAKQALGKKQAALYAILTGQRAGAAAEATKAGDQPSVNVNQEASALEKGFTPQKPISELDYMMGQQQGHFDTKVPYSQYLSGIDDLNNKAKQSAADLADGYRRAASKNPNLTGSQYRDMQQAAPPPAASSSNSGSAWQPK